MSVIEWKRRYTNIDPRKYFFFSSRRRHTRLQGDWSSDVCSSDLGDERLGHRALIPLAVRLRAQLVAAHVRHEALGRVARSGVHRAEHSHVGEQLLAEIGRASCRERV